MIIWCMFPGVQSVTARIFCHFGPSFPLLPPNNPKKKQNFEKTIKGLLSFYTCVTYKWQSYDAWFLTYIQTEWHGQNFWSTWAIFCTFTPLTTWKIKILKTWKKPCKYYSFKHVYHQWSSYGSWQNVLSFWAVNNPENQNFQKCLEILFFYTSAP